VKLQRVKSTAGYLGAAAVITALGICFSSGINAPHAVAGGSGDSPTTNLTTQPSVPVMSINPTAMSLGSTVTQSPAATTLGVASASPTFKATAAAGCVNNGQCP
jgi:hypothetical protein